MAAHILQILTVIAAAGIFFRVEPLINIMGRNCRFVIRAAFWLLAVGSAALIALISQGYIPSVPVVLAFWGVALLLGSERRIKGVLRMTPPIAHERRAEP